MMVDVVVSSESKVTSLNSARPASLSAGLQCPPLVTLSSAHNYQARETDMLAQRSFLQTQEYIGSFSNNSLGLILKHILLENVNQALYYM